ncbi:protein toll-like [Rhagoletis pomonella]|uniref:protein toll-like n=1 Tax=Rhagoletis pomonella TaxID=28610 RepID=UPI00178170D8|nr:protein toll-like [Rhagoletis pomonella]
MLSISHNRFYELPSNTTLGYANVTYLNASYNQIAEILSSQLPPNLTVLDVRNNRLIGLRDDFLFVYLNKNSTLKQLYLAENPWKCDCSGERMLRAVQAFHQRIPDVAQLFCDDRGKQRLLDVDVAGICASNNPYIILESVFAVACFVILTSITLYYKYQLQVKVWLYSQKMCIYFINERELDKEKTFDAFISYAHQEEYFVNQTLLPKLEKGNPKYRICTHERNWVGGAYITEQIVESVAQSRRTIIVLSQHFIESDWGRMEFRTAHQCSLNEGRLRIIIIKYGEITNTELLDRELKAYLDMNTYLVWEDHPWFWSKLRYAMPHKNGEARDAGMLEVSRKVYVMGQVERNRVQ